MKHVVRVLALFALALALFSCQGPVQGPATVDNAQLDADFAQVLASIGTDEAASLMAEFDARYGTTLCTDFAEQLTAQGAKSGGGDSDYPPLSGMPFAVDGAVYLSGGGKDLVGSVIGWVAPKSLPGGFFHGATLDLDKFDPNNLDAPALETAVTKGAGYESANEWMRKVNACVLNPTFAVEKARLDSA